MSDANNRIMMQINSLRKLYGYDMIVIGDFNMNPASFKETLWPQHLGISVIAPPGTTTTFTGCENSLIDFMLVSHALEGIVTDVTAIADTPWRHYGISFKISMRPRDQHALKLVTPKPLPSQKAHEKYEILNDYEKYQTYLKAKSLATKKCKNKKGSQAWRSLGSP